MVHRKSNMFFRVRKSYKEECAMSALVASVVSQDEIMPLARLRKPNERLQLVQAPDDSTLEPGATACVDGDLITVVEQHQSVIVALDEFEEADGPLEITSHDLESDEIAMLFAESDALAEFAIGDLPAGYSIETFGYVPRRKPLRLHGAERRRLQRAATADVDFDDPDHIYARCEPLYLPLQ
jgi:hypothetical protein